MTRRRKEYDWNLNYGDIALMWRGGCIIRAPFLGKIKEAFDRDPKLANLLLDPFFNERDRPGPGRLAARRRRGRRRRASPCPAFTSALAYYDGYRSERLPANLLQAQRDYFGAHTYERIDKPRGEFFHTNWTGRGGTTRARRLQRLIGPRDRRPGDAASSPVELQADFWPVRLTLPRRSEAYG